MRSTGSWYEVLAENHQVFKCRLRGKFKTQDLKVTNPIAVGDVVEFQLEVEDEFIGVITQILPRENYIIRKSVHKNSFGQVLAANLDQAILIVTLGFPKTSMGFIDRFLVSAESFRIPVKLVFNKIDLLNEEGIHFQDEVMEMYEKIGYGTMVSSALKKIGIQKFQSLLDRKKTLVAGHSGVGKSSLVNCIAPELHLKTANVSNSSSKGVHTTTFAEMFEISEATFIIDTPGIKELGLIDISPAELGHYFPEMRALLNECKYHNCLHLNEPNCAIQTAVKANEISMSRYESYLSMLENYDNRR